LRRVRRSAFTASFPCVEHEPRRIGSGRPVKRPTTTSITSAIGSMRGPDLSGKLSTELPANLTVDRPDVINFFRKINCLQKFPCDRTGNFQPRNRDFSSPELGFFNSATGASRKAKGKGLVDAAKAKSGSRPCFNLTNWRGRKAARGIDVSAHPFSFASADQGTMQRLRAARHRADAQRSVRRETQVLAARWALSTVSPRRRRAGKPAV
jgi:hypothetical protein